MVIAFAGTAAWGADHNDGDLWLDRFESFDRVGAVHVWKAGVEDDAADAGKSWSMARASLLL